MSYDSFMRANRRRRKRRQESKFWPRVRAVFLTLGATVLLGTTVAFASAAYAYNQAAQGLPELDTYSSAELAETSTVYDMDGEVVDELYADQNRFVVPEEEMDDSIKDAVVAIEDHRFYEHRGLDFESIGRALRQNIQNLSIQQGGSTITQQLIKNTFIDEEMRSIPSFQRKANEAALAWQYEEEHSKEEILEQYLNTVYFGANAYGAEAAARTYFDKPADELTNGESAMLAGIINLPGTYDPFIDPDSAQARRDVVLDRMLQYGHITEEEHAEAVGEDLEVSRGGAGPEYDEENQYFLDAVRRDLARQYGDEMLYEGGLEIHTTLDPELQDEASESVETVVDTGEGDPSASLVSIEPSTGAVKAMVGGSDFQEVQFNLATQGQRQPGSAFKTFVLAEAVRQGISLESEYISENLSIPLPEDSEQPFYTVENYNQIERGRITLQEAVEASDNTVFVQLAMDLGLEDVVEMAESMGVDSELDPFPSTALGGLREGVTPFEMASAYATLANGGLRMEPYLVDRVTREEDGEEITVEDHSLEEERVLSEDEAAVVNEALQGVVEEDQGESGFPDLSAEFGRPSAGKTGTTEAFVDAWFVGYVPQLATSVWVGYPEERRSMVNIRGQEEINGSDFPLDIWSAFMLQATEDIPAQEFEEPDPDLELEDTRLGVKTEEDAEDEDDDAEDEEEAEDQPSPSFDSLFPQFQQPGESGTPAAGAAEDAGDLQEQPGTTQPGQPSAPQPGSSQTDSPQPSASQPGAAQPGSQQPGVSPRSGQQPRAGQQPGSGQQPQARQQPSRQGQQEAQPESQPSAAQSGPGSGSFEPREFVQGAADD